MPLLDHIKEHFTQSIALLQRSENEISEAILTASQIIHQSLLHDGKIMACGNGGSAADAQHFSAELVGRFERERISLPAIALSTDTSIITAIANDYDFDFIFSKQIEALAKKNDVLLAISTSGNSADVIEAISAAHEKETSVIALTGREGGKIRELLKMGDVLINVPHQRTARIQEVHGLIIHALCDTIDKMLFGENNELSL